MSEHRNAITPLTHAAAIAKEFTEDFDPLHDCRPGDRLIDQFADQIILDLEAPAKSTYNLCLWCNNIFQPLLESIKKDEQYLTRFPFGDIRKAGARD